METIMNAIINCLTQHAVDSIQLLVEDFDARAAKRLLTTHLEPAHFAMPIHDSSVEAKLMAWCRTNEDITTATAFLRFEDTRTMIGIARVLARTHINRQGVANVRQGARWPEQSPRVVDLFDLISDEEDLRRWTDFHSLIDSWLTLAYRYDAPDIGKDCRFSNEDIICLEKLRTYSTDQVRTLSTKEMTKLCGNIGWARVVLGFFTGLHYFEDRFEFRAENIWKTVDNARTASQIDALSLDAQRHIREFGPRLAPSFFADLGNANFVKADTHVTDVVSASLKLPSKAGAQQSIDFVRDLAESIGCTPRAIDKLMYLACSGKFYLSGIKLTKAQALRRKRQLLESLQRL